MIELGGADSRAGLNLAQPIDHRQRSLTAAAGYDRLGVWLASESTTDPAPEIPGATDNDYSLHDDQDCVNAYNCRPVFDDTSLSKLGTSLDDRIHRHAVFNYLFI